MIADPTCLSSDIEVPLLAAKHSDFRIYDNARTFPALEYCPRRAS